MSRDKKQGIYVTQEDIDTALQAARPTETISDADDMTPLFLNESDIVDSGLEVESEDADYFGLLSKEDIEALLHGDPDFQDSREAQDEVDSLSQTTVSGKDAPAQSAPAPERNANQEGVDRMIRDAADAADAKAGDQTASDTSAENAAVAQDDIDQLFVDALDGAGDETEAEPADGDVPPETEGAISQDDIGRLLAGASKDGGEEAEFDFEKTNTIEPEVEPESRDADEALISQTDLDSLMGQAPEKTGDAADASGDSRTASDHISQDDINRLLKESLEEADTLLDEGSEDIAEESDPQEPVILAADEKPAEPTAPAAKPGPVRKLPKATDRHTGKGRGRKNRFVWAAAAGIVLAISVFIVMRSSGPTETPPQPEVLTFSVPQAGKAAPEPTAYSKNSVYLPGFVVLAPPNSSTVSYVAADLTLDFSDASTVAVIKENEAFVRDIIYRTIRDELMNRDISTIDEISLELAIRKALGKIVAREAISRIAFDQFSLV